MPDAPSPTEYAGSLYVVGGEWAHGTAGPLYPRSQGGGVSTVATSPGRLRDDLVGLVHRGADVRDFALGASHASRGIASRSGLAAAWLGA
jgi:hypothetical protein